VITRFEYMVCQVQLHRVTFVNGRWQGKVPVDPEHSKESLDSCPQVWDYLRQVGNAGWELVSAVDSAYGTGKDLAHYQLLFFKRARETVSSSSPANN
jgi:hypothetical protein